MHSRLVRPTWRHTRNTNHPDLELEYSAEPTKASTVLGTLTMDPGSIKVPSLRQNFLHALEKQASWYFNASRTALITDKEWDVYDTILRSLIIGHVLVPFSKINTLDKKMKRLLRGSVDTTDSLSSNPHKVG